MTTLSSNEFFVFAALSIIIIIFSWHVLLRFKSHGFYRFLGWECIAWLTVNNYKYWFDDPFSVYQTISWIFLFYAMVLIVVGVILMKTKGNADKTRKDKTLYSFERTTELIETGIYKYIRHPLYGSLIFLAWGIFFKNTTIEMLVISILSTIFLFITSLIEEKENIKYFGEKYRGYMKRSKMFIPFLL
jgi:protein-S-isoprenylcysteine O-methyltransferase Ste14